MKISIPIIHDSDNSYPTTHLEFHLGSTEVTVALSDSEREVSVSIPDLRRRISSHTDA